MDDEQPGDNLCYVESTEKAFSPNKQMHLDMS